MLKTFTYNGISSADFGILIGSDPKPSRPARKFSVANIAGRNGNLYDIQDAWEEVIQEYQILAGLHMTDTASDLFYRIFDWLNSANGYAELKDDYDPTHYRLAICIDATEVVTGLERFGKATIRFRCRPERFLVNSDYTYTASNSVTAVRATALTAMYSDLHLAKSTQVQKGECVKWLEDVTVPSTIKILAQVTAYKDAEMTVIDSTLSANNYYSVADAGYDDRYGILVGDYLRYIGTANTEVTTTGLYYKVKSYDSNSIGYVNSYYFSAKVNVHELYNPTNRIAKPLIKLTLGSGSAQLIVNDITMELANILNPIIDCETENVTSESGVPLNQRVTITDIDGNATPKFISLKKGMNIIQYSGSMDIDARFWEI